MPKFSTSSCNQLPFDRLCRISECDKPRKRRFRFLNWAVHSVQDKFFCLDPQQCIFLFLFCFPLSHKVSLDTFLLGQKMSTETIFPGQCASISSILSRRRISVGSGKCYQGVPSACPPNSCCIDTATNYYCRCEPGYRMEGGSCRGDHPPT